MKEYKPCGQINKNRQRKAKIYEGELKSPKKRYLRQRLQDKIELSQNSGVRRKDNE